MRSRSALGHFIAIVVSSSRFLCCLSTQWPGPAWDYETWSVQTETYQAPLPEYIPPDVQYAGGYRHTVEVAADGAVFVYGRNDFGQLGDGTVVNRLEPVRVKSAVRYAAGVAVKLKNLEQRVSDDLDILDGPTGTLQEYDYETERWVIRMSNYDGNVAVLAGIPAELESKEPLDDDVPPASTRPPQGNRRRSGCRVTDSEQLYAYILHDDGSRNLIGSPSTDACVTSSLVVPDEVLKMYLPRYGESSEGYTLNENASATACTTVPLCKACNTYDDDVECPNDPLVCDPDVGGVWQHEVCKLKFTPGMLVTLRQLELTPQIELNGREGVLVRMNTKNGMEWESELDALTCLSGVCDSGNVLSITLPVNNYEINGEALAAAAGRFHSVFLWADFSIWTTGLNREGQLGDGSTIDRNFPKFVFRNCTGVAAGDFHSVFLHMNGTAFTVGRNKEGQLGDGTYGFKTKPVSVLEDVVAVAAGAYHTVFLKEDSTVWTVGSNVYGQLGDGSTVGKNVPTKVFQGVTSIIAGEFYTLFVTYDETTEVTTLWSAGLFDSGLQDRDTTAWSPLQFFNETEVQMMTVDMD
eukprot:CAMPEP_0206547588 /NCGR_PEP_ID=MMETSP0325_2-20121206/13383_1 /ASSEMBLY_ACC=CAM_ASM_000347 /TAXON_ID=2866 /ORGANISM="Crypthecodinium cohnii, Strain Seligo" /LENGTH=579 /DNA_ID=CAMNT_0054046917 /DNA_START=118 /DNA_END=1857 /DNA_ORIENTATION=+